MVCPNRILIPPSPHPSHPAALSSILLPEAPSSVCPPAAAPCRVRWRQGRRDGEAWAGRCGAGSPARCVGGACPRDPRCRPRVQIGGTALIVSAQGGHVEVVRLLLEKGANVHAAAQVRALSLSNALTH